MRKRVRRRERTRILRGMMRTLRWAQVARGLKLEMGQGEVVQRVLPTPDS